MPLIQLTIRRGVERASSMLIWVVLLSVTIVVQCYQATPKIPYQSAWVIRTWNICRPKERVVKWIKLGFIGVLHGNVDKIRYFNSRGTNGVLNAIFLSWATPSKYNNDKDNSINVNDNRNNIVKALKLMTTRWRTNSNSANQSESRKLFEFRSLSKNIVVIIVWVNDTKKYRLNSSLFILHMFWFLNLFNSWALFCHFFVLTNLKFPA